MTPAVVEDIALTLSDVQLEAAFWRPFTAALDVLSHALLSTAFSALLIVSLLLYHVRHPFDPIPSSVRFFVPALHLVRLAFFPFLIEWLPAIDWVQLIAGESPSFTRRVAVIAMLLSFDSFAHFLLVALILYKR